MRGADAPVRIAVDIGGTFTDVVLEETGRRLTRASRQLWPMAPSRFGSVAIGEPRSWVKGADRSCIMATR